MKSESKVLYILRFKAELSLYLNLHSPFWQPHTSLLLYEQGGRPYSFLAAETRATGAQAAVPALERRVTRPPLGGAPHQHSLRAQGRAARGGRRPRSHAASWKGCVFGAVWKTGCVSGLWGQPVASEREKAKVVLNN